MATTGNADTRGRLEEILSRRIMVLDGSMGAPSTPMSSPRRMSGDPVLRHGFDIKNCTEVLVLTQPKLIEDIHRAYLEAAPTSSRPTRSTARPCRSRSSDCRSTSSS